MYIQSVYYMFVYIVDITWADMYIYIFILLIYIYIYIYTEFLKIITEAMD